MKPGEMIVGCATRGAAFEAAAAKLPPEARAKIRAALDTPRARAFAAFRARVAKAQGAERAKLARAPLEMAKAKAHAAVQGAEREATEDVLRKTLGASHGLLARLNANRRD